jgi:hypothetical protein
MLQLPQSFAWLQDAPEPFVVIERRIVVVPANRWLDEAIAIIAPSSAASIARRNLIPCAISFAARRGVLANHGGTLLADHDCRRVGVAGRHSRHYRSVDDTQPGNAANSQP